MPFHFLSIGSQSYFDMSIYKKFSLCRPIIYFLLIGSQSHFDLLKFLFQWTPIPFHMSIIRLPWHSIIYQRHLETTFSASKYHFTAIFNAAKKGYCAVRSISQEIKILHFTELHSSKFARISHDNGNVSLVFLKVSSWQNLEFGKSLSWLLESQVMSP
jgi:hypothetical protein